MAEIATSPLIVDLINGALLGIVEGLTEFLPVSSTGHLIITGRLLDFHGARADTFEVFIQLGAILAVVALYWRRFLGLVNASAGGGLSGLRGCMVLAVACLPVFVLGFLLRSFIRDHLFSVQTVAWALLVGGCIMVALEWRAGSNRGAPGAEDDTLTPQLSPKVSSLDNITLAQAVKVGLFQCLALWPGMSRSASTIIGGLLVGIERKVAAEFSFLVAVPVMVVAVGYDLLKSMKFLSTTDIPLFATGFGVAFIVAIFAIRTFIKLLATWTLAPFGWYRIIFGGILLMLMN